VSVLAAAVGVALAVASTANHAQTSADASRGWRTSWGHPDLQGVWTTDAEILVQFQRPAEFGDRATLSAAEIAKRTSDAEKRARDDKDERGPAPSLITPAHWFEVGNVGSGVSVRTSLVVDPSNGRMPPLKPEAATQKVDRRYETGLLGEAEPLPVNGPEDTGLAARCITRGVPETWIPSIYNNGFKILQTPDHVVIFYERYHEYRIIPLDGRPHVGQGIRQWIGDSRGRWEGNTLVIDVTNFGDKARFRGAGSTLHVVERLTRVDRDTVNVNVTVEDETRWARPWKFEVNGRRDSKYRMFEMACHEGNYSMAYMLSAARNLEKAEKK
jgi:hypothetical protein